MQKNGKPFLRAVSLTSMLLEIKDHYIPDIFEVIESSS
jgi:hypothetical protein